MTYFNAFVNFLASSWRKLREVLLGLQIELVSVLSDLKVQYKPNNARDGKLIPEWLRELVQVFFPFESDFPPGTARVSCLRIFSADQIFFGRKDQNHQCEISRTTFYPFYVSPHLLLRLSESFRWPQLHFFQLKCRKKCPECSFSDAIVFTNNFWGQVRRAATCYSVFRNSKFTL